MTYFTLLKRSRALIARCGYDPNVAAYLIQRRWCWDNTRLLMHEREAVPPERLRQFLDDLHLYLSGWPPQYVIGTAPFYGYNFRVNRHVLIPRPETEGLVDWLLHDQPIRPLRIIDVGTGSGCIAIALKLQRPRWRITATDISSAALRVARLNAKFHHASVAFQRRDLLRGLPADSFDVIISNPPYVAHDEIKFMDRSVIRYEPSEALFAAHHGLLMDQRLAGSFRRVLRPGGSLYLEIGFRQARAVRKIFAARAPGFRVRIRRDLAGHPRMVKVKHL